MDTRLMVALRARAPVSGQLALPRSLRPESLGFGGHTGSGLHAIGRRLQILNRAVENEVVPRLLLAQRGLSGARPPPAPACAIVPDDVERLADALLAPNTDMASAQLSRLTASGVSPELLYLDLMAPAARRLGELWTQDRCHFTEVTLGLWRLQHMFHELSPSFLHECGACPGDCRRILLSAPAGEQHTFGLSMVSGFLQRAAWEVALEPPAAAANLAALVRNGWFAVVGLTASSDEMLDALSVAIRAIRRNSRNPAVGILVGGTVFAEQPDLVHRIGADAMAADAPQAVLQAEALLKLLVDQAYATPS